MGGGDTRARNNACWKCGERGHFARECPKSTFDYNPKEDSAGRLNHHYIGSTDVSKQLWSEFLQKAAKAQANQMVWAAKYKKLKDLRKIQQQPQPLLQLQGQVKENQSPLHLQL